MRFFPNPVMRAAIIVLSALLCPAGQFLMGAQTPGRLSEDLALERSAPAATDLPLDATQRLELEKALQLHDYKPAEILLVEEAGREPKSPRAAKLFTFVGGIFFLDGQYLNSVIAWKKAQAIAPLDERSRFTLAMALVHLNRRDWARTELENLVAARPGDPIYLYWLARLDYDGRDYAAAITKFQKVIELDPKMMRAYDGLGLCHDYVGQLDEAINDYHRAIELSRQQLKPSPWPNVDLGVALIEKNRLADAEKSLREAIGYDPRLPQAHYELGRVLDEQHRSHDAIDELKRAAELDTAYPDPHYRLGQIYRRLGKNELAKTETDLFLQLKKAAETQPALKSQIVSRQP
jgi:tetratricopeptide (TPR) repeat protein